MYTTNWIWPIYKLYWFGHMLGVCATNRQSCDSFSLTLTYTRTRTYTCTEASTNTHILPAKISYRHSRCDIITPKHRDWHRQQQDTYTLTLAQTHAYSSKCVCFPFNAQHWRRASLSHSCCRFIFYVLIVVHTHSVCVYFKWESCASVHLPALNNAGIFV